MPSATSHTRFRMRFHPSRGDSRRWMIGTVSNSSTPPRSATLNTSGTRWIVTGSSPISFRIPASRAYSACGSAMMTMSTGRVSRTARMSSGAPSHGAPAVPSSLSPRIPSTRMPTSRRFCSTRMISAAGSPPPTTTA